MTSFIAPLQALVEQPMAWPVFVAAYLLGSIPFGLLLAKQFAGLDVRAAGSKNIGATNVARVAGKKLGIITLLLDALKGAIPVLLATHLLAGPIGVEPQFLGATAGLCAFLGHCFPLWLRFKGGKGVATGAGVLLAHLPVLGLLAFGVFTMIFLLGRKVSLASLVSAFAVMFGLPMLYPFSLSMIVVVIMFIVLVGRHHENIRRLLKKEELGLKKEAAE